jgi:integrase
VARLIGKLTSLRLESLTRARKGGMTSDGGGLYFRIDPRHGGASWVFRYRDRITYKLRDKGLGSYPAIGLKEARMEATRLRVLRVQGIDPINSKRQALAAARIERGLQKTFGECAKSLIEVEKHGWSAKTLHSWQTGLFITAKALERRPINEITTEEVVAVLKPIWHSVTYSADRLRGRIQAVFDHGRERKYFHGDNPAVWKGGVRGQLPKPSSIASVEHHPAMPYGDIPEFMRALIAMNVYGSAGLSAKSLALTILTACRVSEVVKAEWQEFDLENSLWTIPKERMKSREPHVVPLTSECIKLLKTLHPRESGYVFMSSQDRIGSERPLSIASPYKFLKQLEPDYTVHGFRSTFRSWAGAMTDFPREVAEAALAHAEKDKVEAAYMRDKYLAKRRLLMDAWSAYLHSNHKDSSG